MHVRSQNLAALELSPYQTGPWNKISPRRDFEEYCMLHLHVCTKFDNYLRPYTCIVTALRYIPYNIVLWYSLIPRAQFHLFKFSACNIEKVGLGWEWGYYGMSVVRLKVNWYSGRSNWYSVSNFAWVAKLDPYWLDTFDWLHGSWVDGRLSLLYRQLCHKVLTTAGQMLILEPARAIITIMRVR